MSLVQLLAAFDHCRLHGTSHKQSGVRVSIRPHASEEIVFFCVDPNQNPDCKLRAILELDNELICDLVVLYRNSVEVIICLIELKGRHIDHAIEQINSTYNAILRVFNGDLHREVKWRAYIKQNISAPNLVKKPSLKQKIKIAHTTYNRFLIGRNEDLSVILRN